ncbi:MAG: hypothetical protein HQ541_19350 [Mariniphaga sp.]|nr:hypothetical protein [Mariniphaga sp.]
MISRKKLFALLPLSIVLITMLLFVCSCSEKAVQEPAIKKENMDLTVNPGDDFFRYANGNWIKNNEIPEDRSRYGSFDIVRKKRDADVRALLDEVTKEVNAEKGSISQKIRDFYASGMDSAKIEEAGISSLQKELDLIAAIPSTEDFQDVVAKFHTYGLYPLFGGGLEQDLMDSKIYKFYLMQAGIGLPDRDYYTTEDERSEEIRTEYVKHVAKMFEIKGDDAETAKTNAETVMAIETRLAENSKTNTEMRDIPGWYNKMSLSKLQEHADGFDWSRYFNNISDIDFGDVIVAMPKFFKEVGVMVKEIPVDDWKVYLTWNSVNRSAEYLSSDFVNQDFSFYSEFLSGSKEIKPRWERVVGVTNNAMGEPLGQLYVEKHFPPALKKKMVELVGYLKKALKIRLENLEWMSDSTKQAAFAKLELMGVKIGYPDKWEDFSKLEIEADSYVQNVMRANQFAHYKDLDRFGKPVDQGKMGNGSSNC